MKAAGHEQDPSGAERGPAGTWCAAHEGEARPSPHPRTSLGTTETRGVSVQTERKTDVPRCLISAAGASRTSLATRRLGLAAVAQAGEPVPDRLVTVGPALGQANHPTARDEVPHLVLGYRDHAGSVLASGARQEDVGSVAAWLKQDRYRRHSRRGNQDQPEETRQEAGPRPTRGRAHLGRQRCWRRCWPAPAGRRAQWGGTCTGCAGCLRAPRARNGNGA